MSLTRRCVTFISKGARCTAFLCVPGEAGAKKRFPAIVMAHGLGSTKEMQLRPLQSYSPKLVSSPRYSIIATRRVVRPGCRPIQVERTIPLSVGQ